MSINKFANNFSTTLNGGITDIQTTITVANAAGLPAIGAGEQYYLTIDDGTNIEVVLVTDDASSPTLTVTRNADGNGSFAFLNGDAVEMRPDAKQMGDCVQNSSASVTDNTLARFDSTTGKIIQSGQTTEDDSGNIGVAGNITVGGTVDGRDLATDGTKLDGIEALADVTDETNVKAALDGATLTAATVAGTDKVLIQDADASNALKTVTAQSIADLAAGGGGGITPISANVTKSGVQSIPNATVTTLTWDTENWDTDTLHDNVTNNSRFTIQTAGKYMIAANLTFASNNTGIRQIIFNKNGASSLWANIFPNNGAGEDQIFTFFFADLSVSDYIECRAYQASGSSLNVTTSSFFSIVRVDS